MVEESQFDCRQANVIRLFFHCVQTDHEPSRDIGTGDALGAAAEHETDH